MLIQNPQSKIQNRIDGQALVPVLFVVLILTGLAVALSATAKRESRSAASQTQAVQAALIERGAINYAMAELEQVTNGGSAPPQLTVPPNTDANGWTQLGDGWFKMDIIDTASRVNINTSNVNTLAKIPAFQNDPNIAPSIVDWRDTDSNVTTLSNGGTGAESDYYEALNPPYQAKNAPFDTVDELLLVRDVTPSMLYGMPGVNNYALSRQNPLLTSAAGTGSSGSGTGSSSGSSSGSNPSVPPVDTSQSTTPTSELVTTDSRELDYYSDGTGEPRLNIKTASAQTMQSQLGITQAIAQRIVNGRGNGGANLNSVADLLNAQTFGGITRTIMQQIADKITVGTGQWRTDVVNINTAPPEVIAALPGMTANIYNTIIQARQSGTVFNGMGDIYALSGLQATDLTAVANDFCTKSSDYIVRVRVRFPGSTHVYAAEALIELAPPASQTGTGAGATGTGGTGTSAASSATNNGLPQPQLLQFREVQQYPGWSSWVAPPAAFYTNGTTGTAGSMGGSLGIP